MRSKIYPIIIICLFTIACKKEQSATVTTNASPKVATQSVNSSLIREIASLPTYDERKAAYVSMLTAYEKYTVWQTRFQSAIASNAFNAGQLTLINEMVAKFTPSIFSNKTVRDSLSYFFSEWQFRAEKSFSLAQLRYLGSDVVTFNKADFIQLAKGDIAVQQATIKIMGGCTCSSNNGDFCGSGLMCGGDCGEGEGCGWGWQYKCNGNCRPAAPEIQ